MSADPTDNEWARHIYNSHNMREVVDRLAAYESCGGRAWTLHESSLIAYCHERQANPAYKAAYKRLTHLKG